MIKFVCSNCSSHCPKPTTCFQNLSKVVRFNQRYCPYCGHQLNSNPEPRFLLP